MIKLNMLKVLICLPSVKKLVLTHMSIVRVYLNCEDCPSPIRPSVIRSRTNVK